MWKPYGTHTYTERVKCSSWSCSRWYVYSPLYFRRWTIFFQRVHNWKLLEFSKHESGYVPSKRRALLVNNHSVTWQKIRVPWNSFMCLLLNLNIYRPGSACLSARMFQFKKQYTKFDKISKNIIIVKANYLYRVNIKSFPDYKHLLQENYVKYKQ
jgi:hypothetical protein